MLLRVLYTGVFLVLLPFIFARLWWKEKKVPGYRVRWLQRLGVFRPIRAPKPVIWIHAVSVGEVIAAGPLIRQLLREGRYTLMVTTMPPTGSARVTASFGGEVAHVYAPFDLPWTVAAFIRRVKPVLTVIMETELWPNMLVECAHHRIPIVLANARMSARSAARYARFPKTTKGILGLLDCVAVQNAVDGERFLQLGVASDKLAVIGSVKFDVVISQSMSRQAQSLKEAYSLKGARPIWMAASTHEGEERLLLEAFTQLLEDIPNLLLVIVPRHPERFDEIYTLCNQSFTTLRRSTGKVPKADTQIVLGDTMGELMLLYGASDLAFVGGSLIDRGGHNMIEPAAWGLPVLSGSHTFNFAQISQDLVAAHAMAVVHNVPDLVSTIRTWLADADQRREVGQKAKAFVDQNRGAVGRLMTEIQKLTP